MSQILSFKSSKKKFQALIAGLALLFLLAYRFSINKTISAYTYRLQSKSLEVAQNAPTSIQQYQQLKY